MSSYSWKQNALDFGPNCSGLFDQFSENLGGFNGNWRSGSMSAPQSLVLDGERSELVKASGAASKKSGVSEAKAIAALKSHSEAERRRRERINAHLATLRGLVPGTEKMDKAALLAEVISQVKQLKKTATEVSQGLLVPIDVDEVRVEPVAEGAGPAAVTFRATICCDYRPELLSDLRHALDSFQINMVKAETSTLGGRVKNVFLFTSGVEMNSHTMEAQELFASSLHQALSSVLDKISLSPEYSSLAMLPYKRRRLSYLDSSSSSS